MGRDILRLFSCVEMNVIKLMKILKKNYGLIVGSLTPMLNLEKTILIFYFDKCLSSCWIHHSPDSYDLTFMSSYDLVGMYGNGSCGKNQKRRLTICFHLSFFLNYYNLLFVSIESFMLQKTQEKEKYSN